ncbi:MAG: hypothetical protein D8M61_04800 [Ignavibacteriae bacterium]|nr:hypothetical protein [Ignavibacteriota bacterium]
MTGGLSGCKFAGFKLINIILVLSLEKCFCYLILACLQVCYLCFVICYLLFVICCLSFEICYLLFVI